jgi:hypothetical protein
MKDSICENPLRRERIVDALEATCSHPAALSAAASGKAVAASVTDWKSEVPRQAAADKVVVVKC